MRSFLKLFAAVLLATSACAATSPAVAQQDADWHREVPCFKVAQNLHYVGTADLAVYLLTTPQGHILINSDFKQDLALIKKSIKALGFRYEDIKIVLISHAHGD